METAWIKRTDMPATSGVEPSVEQAGAVVPGIGSIAPSATFVKDDDAADGRYVCQYTQLVRASTRMRPSIQSGSAALIAGNLR